MAMMTIEDKIVCLEKTIDDAKKVNDVNLVNRETDCLEELYKRLENIKSEC